MLEKVPNFPFHIPSDSMMPEGVMFVGSLLKQPLDSQMRELKVPMELRERATNLAGWQVSDLLVADTAESLQLLMNQESYIPHPVVVVDSGNLYHPSGGCAAGWLYHGREGQEVWEIPVVQQHVPLESPTL